MQANLILATSILGLSVSFSAQAGMMLMDSIPLTQTELNTAAGNNSLRVDRFDTMGNTRQLDKVTITLDASLANGDLIMGTVGNGSVTNQAGSPQDFTISFTIDNAFVAAPVGVSTALASQTFFSPGATISSQMFTNLGGGSSVDYTEITPITRQIVIEVTDSTKLMEFVGMGQYGFDLTTEVRQQFNPSNTTNVSVDVNTYASASLAVDYAFSSPQAPTPGVPTPGTLALLGLGLLGMRRRLMS